MEEVIQHLEYYDYSKPFELVDVTILPKLIQEARRKETSPKCLHRDSELIRTIAFHPSLISVIKEILGSEFCLWGSSLIVSPPNHTHRYHVDAEHFHIDGVSVSIALENCTEKNSFYFMSNSDSIPAIPQQLTQNIEKLEAMAQQYNTNARHVDINMKDGQCVIWKGRTWHSTKNRSTITRLSLILQYAVSNPNIPNNYNNPEIPASEKCFDAIFVDLS
jgi:ectoine hydroxylase-related dioxygenase (phytanoyl-CoA dioxygenase family)